MRLTTFTDYSLRVLIYLAARPARRSTVADIAAAFGVSQHHLVKVVHFLGQGGWLDNARGRRGGVRLARPAAEINLADVVRLTEGSDVPAACFGHGDDPCAIARGCRLRGALAEAVEAFYVALGAYTLEDVVANRAALAKVLFHPALPRS